MSSQIKSIEEEPVTKTRQGDWAKRVVMFRSSHFNAEGGYADFPGNVPPGEDFAKAIILRSESFGVSTDQATLCDDDGGWLWRSAVADKKYCVSLHSWLMQDSTDDHWVVQLDIKKSVFRSLVGSPATESELRPLLVAMHSCLDNWSMISSLQWLTMAELK